MKSPLSGLALSLVLLASTAAGYVALRLLVSARSVAVADLAHEIEVKSAAANRLATVRETLASLADEEAAVERYFVGNASVVPFIEELQSRGKALGAAVAIASVATAPASEEGRPKLLIALSITGPFDAVMRTLGSIEYAPYALRVTGLTLSRGVEEGWRANASLSVGSAAASAPVSGFLAPAPAAIPPLVPLASSTPASTTTVTPSPGQP